MKAYPKIQSLYKREGVTYDEEKKEYVYEKRFKHPLIIGDYASPEFGLIKNWDMFEKIDGTNIRITLFSVPEVKDNFLIQGRKKDSKIPGHLMEWLSNKFTKEKMREAFPNAEMVTLYGEGYGPKIQASGHSYDDKVGFVLFDVQINGWWMSYDQRLEVCEKLDIKHVPKIDSEVDEEEVVDFVRRKPKSRFAIDPNFVMEGVVCSTEPLLRGRNGDIVKFKLRVADLE